MMHRRVTIPREHRERRTGEYSNERKTMSIRSDQIRMTGTGPITSGNGERTRVRKPTKRSKRSDLESTATGRTSNCSHTSRPMWSIFSKTTAKMINARRRRNSPIGFDGSKKESHRMRKREQSNEKRRTCLQSGKNWDSL